MLVAVKLCCGSCHLPQADAVQQSELYNAKCIRIRSCNISRSLSLCLSFFNNCCDCFFFLLSCCGSGRVACNKVKVAAVDKAAANNLQLVLGRPPCTMPFGAHLKIYAAGKANGNLPLSPSLPATLLHSACVCLSVPRLLFVFFFAAVE